VERVDPAAAAVAHLPQGKAALRLQGLRRLAPQLVALELSVGEGQIRLPVSAAAPPGRDVTGLSTFGIGNGSAKGDRVSGLVGKTSV
jgi:hypothetical protein